MAVLCDWRILNIASTSVCCGHRYWQVVAIRIRHVLCSLALSGGRNQVLGQFFTSYWNSPSIVFASMILMMVLVVIHSSMERDGDSYVSDIVWNLRVWEVSNSNVAGNGQRPQIQSLIQTYKEVSRPLFFAHGVMSVRSSLLLASFLFIAVVDLLLN